MSDSLVEVAELEAEATTDADISEELAIETADSEE